jgi:hypothetical protein
VSRERPRINLHDTKLHGMKPHQFEFQGSPNRAKMGIGLKFFDAPERLQATPN